MIADFRKKPSLARQRAVEKEKRAAEQWVVGIDPAFQNVGIAMVWYNPRNGIISNYATPLGVETIGETKKREKRRRS
jgi:hypothetical protein